MKSIKSSQNCETANQTTSVFNQSFDDFNNMIIDGTLMQKYSIKELESQLNNQKDAISNILM